MSQSTVAALQLVHIAQTGNNQRENNWDLVENFRVVPGSIAPLAYSIFREIRHMLDLAGEGGKSNYGGSLRRRRAPVVGSSCLRRRQSSHGTLEQIAGYRRLSMFPHLPDPESEL